MSGVTKLKTIFLNTLYKSPRTTGWSVFFLILSLTMYLSFIQYSLRISNEREQVISKLNEIENLISSSLNNGISAAKTLGFYAQNQENITRDFDLIGREILESNPLVDVIQYLDSGTIVAVYPRKGNETVIGFNVLDDPKNKKEVEESIRRRDVFFSGPFPLKQGGIGIVGRYPLFEKGQLKGLSAVIIHFDALLKNARISNLEESKFHVELSKINPNTGINEKLLDSGDSTEYFGYKASVPIEIGNWILSVQLKKSMALADTLVSIGLRFVLSLSLGLFAWYFAQQPAILTKKVEEQSKELREANERFEFAVKATSDVIWDWNLITDKVYRSDQFSEMLGYDQSEIVGNNQFWTSIIHPDDFARVLEKIQETMASDNQYWEQEFRVKKANGTYAYIIDKGYIIRDRDGKPIRMIGATQDISTRKFAELELIEANKSLKNANEELKVFASLASHDMREPLRMISSFMSLLQKKYSGALDDKAQQYISFAVDGAKRLTFLINDLLEYSKVGFDQKNVEPLQVNSLIEEVLALKSSLIRESGATIVVDPLPEIKGIKTPIQILFQNLIGNAIKYRNPDSAPSIKISGRELPDFWEFSIKDNGIGIDPDYLEEIFGIFKRLHPKEKYPGTGMGLATCKKIVMQHGGKIWAESIPGEGSKFLFTIRKI